MSTSQAVEKILTIHLFWFVKYCLTSLHMPAFKTICHLKNKTIKRTKICDNEVSSEYTLLH